MADRELSVKINLGVGRNDAGGALREQGRAAEELAKRLGHVEELQKRIAALSAMQPAANTPVARRLGMLREQMEQIPGHGPAAGRAAPGGPSATLDLSPPPSAVTSPAVARATLSEARQRLKLRGQVPEGQSKDDWQAAFDAMVEQEDRARDEARRRSLANLAKFRLTGEIPGEEISRVQPTYNERLGSQAGRIAAGQFLGVTQRGAHPTGNPLSGAASLIGSFSSLPGPIGAFASGLSVATSAAGFVVSAFFKVRDSSASLIAAQAALLNDLRSGRSSGLATPEGLQRVLTPGEYSRLEAHQRAGDTAGGNQVIAQATARLQGQAAGAGNGAQNVARANVALDQAEEIIRSTVYRSTPSTGMAGPISYNRRDLRRHMLQLAGLDPELFGQISNEDMTPAARRELAGLAGGPGVAASNALTGLRNILRSGVPNLAPGAPNLNELPALFRSQQSDVLDLHSQVQQEAVRDMRQEAQFQAQMQLWQEIYQWWQAHPPGEGAVG